MISNYEDILNEASKFRRFTANQLAKHAGLQEPYHVRGRTLKSALNELVLDSKLEYDRGYYWLPKQVKTLSTKPIFELSPDIFKQELSKAMDQGLGKTRSERWWESNIKKVEVSLKVPDLGLVADEDLVFNAPEAPVRGSTKRTFDEALEGLTHNYDKEPSKTVQELGAVVLHQRDRLQAQDRLIREMHVCVRDMYRILNLYINRSPKDDGRLS